MEVYITRGAEGKESRAFVGAISDEKAMDLAAKVVSEGFVFTVSFLFSLKSFCGLTLESSLGCCGCVNLGIYSKLES